jgi:iron complex transport system ATP-binding protein
VSRARRIGTAHVATCVPQPGYHPFVADVLWLEGVSLSRDGQPVLREIDWTVADGQRWAVLGPNGAGKTTLLEVASLYQFPSSGRVTVLGAVHGQTDVRSLRRRIGYSSAALARLLHPDLRVLEAVATGRTGVLDPYWAEPTEADMRLASTLLGRLGCGPLAGRPLGALSDGERQRVQIARALMASPDLLLLDEPAAGLDLGAREQLVHSLAELAGDARMRAIVLVTHHVEEIPPGFTHVLLLRRGRVLASGPIESTLSPKVLSACFGLPLAIEIRDGRWSARGTRAPGGEPGHPESEREGERGRRARGAAPEIGMARADSLDSVQGPAASALIRDPDGRLKAYRPLPPERRLELLDRCLAAYVAGDFFAAHEMLEPAWMGTDDPAERALHQGLIKLAAAGVHASRGNAEGVRRNLEGSARRLDLVPAQAAGALGEALRRVDLAATRGWIEAVLDADLHARDDAARASLARLVAAGPAPVAPRSGAG